MLLLCVSFPALAQEGGAEGFWFPQSTNPAGDVFVHQNHHSEETSKDPLAVLRTGIKKGIRGNQLEAELIMLGEQILALKNQGAYADKLAKYEKQINEMKMIIRSKKKEL